MTTTEKGFPAPKKKLRTAVVEDSARLHTAKPSPALAHSGTRRSEAEGRLQWAAREVVPEADAGAAQRPAVHPLGGGGLEPKSPKVCVPKIAQINISFCKCHSHYEIRVEGGGGGYTPHPPLTPRRC